VVGRIIRVGDTQGLTPAPLPLVESHAATKGSGTHFSVTIPGQPGAAFGWIGLPPAGEMLKESRGSGVLLFPDGRRVQASLGRDQRGGRLMIPPNFRFHIFANPVGDVPPCERRISENIRPNANLARS
jgi:hypothetical protein